MIDIRQCDKCSMYNNATWGTFFYSKPNFYRWRIFLYLIELPIVNNGLIYQALPHEWCGIWKFYSIGYSALAIVSVFIELYQKFCVAFIKSIQIQSDLQTRYEMHSVISIKYERNKPKENFLIQHQIPHRMFLYESIVNSPHKGHILIHYLIEYFLVLHLLSFTISTQKSNKKKEKFAHESEMENCLKPHKNT